MPVLGRGRNEMAAVQLRVKELLCTGFDLR